MNQKHFKPIALAIGSIVVFGATQDAPKGYDTPPLTSRREPDDRLLN